MRELRGLLTHMRARPTMYFGRQPSSKEFFAFLLGLDVSGHLTGFREWLIVRTDGGNNLVIEAVAAHALDPSGVVPPERDAELVDAMFDWLDEFLEATSESGGLAAIYEAWATRRSRSPFPVGSVAAITGRVRPSVPVSGGAEGLKQTPLSALHRSDCLVLLRSGHSDRPVVARLLQILYADRSKQIGRGEDNRDVPVDRTAVRDSFIALIDLCVDWWSAHPATHADLERLADSLEQDDEIRAAVRSLRPV